MNISMPETDTLEFKSCKDGNIPSGIDKTISAMANSRGGEILFGVDNSGGILNLGSSELDSLQKSLSSLMTTDNKFSDRIKYDILVLNGYVKMTIKEADIRYKPILVSKNKKAYVRRGSTTVEMNKEEYMSMIIASSYGSAENKPLQDLHMNDIDVNGAREYADSIRGFDGINMSDTKKFTKLGILSDGSLTVFGVLAFGNPTQDISPTVRINFREYSGVSKVDGLDSREIYLDSREFSGNIISQFKDSFSFLLTKIPTKHIFDDLSGERREVRILPEVALREALANAIVHRDYGVVNSAINIDLYIDRIEITNPGESLVDISKIDAVGSTARNPRVMELFKAKKFTEASARGILTILQSVRERGLISPKFENISGSFKATLYFSTPHSKDDSLWVNEELKSFNLRDSQKNALVYIRNNGYITNGLYCEINSMHSRNDNQKALRELKSMVKLGLVRSEGVLKNTKYYLND